MLWRMCKSPKVKGKQTGGMFLGGGDAAYLSTVVELLVVKSSLVKTETIQLFELIKASLGHCC